MQIQANFSAVRPETSGPGGPGDKPLQPADAAAADQALKGIDQVQAPAAGKAPLGTPPIKGQLELKLQDRDGLLVRSADDLDAQLSGEFVVQPEFILKQLADLPLGKDMRMNPPKFDAERRQYVLSGKALDVILGMINVGFEVRLGAQNGQLAFRVDNAIKRGIIYKVLAKQLGKLGLDTERQDHQLLVKPSYNKALNLPIGKDGQTASVNGIKASPQEISFSMDAQGQLIIKLKDAKLALSSDSKGAKAHTAEADQLEITLDLSLDQQLNPSITIQDGELQTSASSATLNTLVKAPVADQIRQQLGSDLKLQVADLQGQLELKQGLQLQASAQVQLSGSDDAHLKTRIEVKHQGKETQLQASQLDAQSLSGQKISAASVSYANQQVSVQDLDGQVQLKTAQGEIKAQVQDLDGSLQKGADGQLQIQSEGQIQAELSQDGTQASIRAEGKQKIKLTGQEIDVHLEQAEVKGSLDASKPKPAQVQEQTKTQPDKSSKPAKADQSPPQIRLEVDVLTADAQAQLPEMQIKGQIKEAHTTVTTQDGLKIQVDGQLQASAQGERIQAEVKAQGASLELGPNGQLEAELKNHQSQGSFKSQGKAQVAGKLSGDLSLALNEGKVVAQTTQGHFDARMSAGQKVSVSGQGGNARLELINGEDVNVRVENLDLTTSVNAGNAKVKARTRGKAAEVSVSGDDIRLKTQGSRSDLNVGIKQNVKASGQTADVQMHIHEGEQERISIQAQDADVKANVTNAKKTLDLKAKAKADLDVTIAGQDVTIAAEQSQTQVDMQLNKKVALQAQGRDFTVKVKGDDLDIAMEQGSFRGQITPNERIRVDAKSDKAARLKVSVDEHDKGSDIQVQADSPVSGYVNINGKLDSDFKNPDGFKLKVADAEAEVISVEMQDLGLKGKVETPGVQAELAGAGDFKLQINDGDQVNIGYDGAIAGAANVSGQARADYKLAGKVDVEINQQDLDIRTQSTIKAKTSQTRFGAQGQASIDAQTQPLHVSLKDQQLSLELPAGVDLQLNDLQKLKLDDNPAAQGILKKLESESIQIQARNLALEGKDLSLELSAEGIQTEYGQIDLSLQADKSGQQLEISAGKLKLTPDMDFYELLRETLSKKYNIQIQGKPSFENGAIQFEGQARSKTGVMQLARFEMKATVEDNKLVFELEKAKILGLIGTNTTGKIIKHFLSKTDIDVFRSSSGKMEIALADIAKDLSMTQGVNFTGLQLVDNRFEVDFSFKTQDQQVARLAKADDVAGLKKLLASKHLTDFSGESLSTAFSTYTQTKDTDAAIQLLEQVAKAYTRNLDPQVRYELGRALDWMARSNSARKKDVSDDIALSFAREFKPNTPAGAALIKALPKAFIETLANNLDQTLSQGGGMSWITPEERKLANQLRRLHHLPENHRAI